MCPVHVIGSGKAGDFKGRGIINGYSDVISVDGRVGSKTLML